MIINGAGSQSEAHVFALWFSRAGSVRSCAHSGRSHPPFAPPLIACCLVWSCHGSPRPILEILIPGQHRPDLSGHLVGQRNRCQHFRLAIQYPGQPRARNDLSSFQPVRPRHGPDDQEPPNIGLSSFRGATEAIPSSRGIVAAAPTRAMPQVTPAPDQRHAGAERFPNQSCQRADTGHGAQVPRCLRMSGEILKCPAPRGDPRRIFRNLRQQILTFLPQQPGKPLLSSATSACMHPNAPRPMEQYGHAHRAGCTGHSHLPDQSLAFAKQGSPRLLIL